MRFNLDGYFSYSESLTRYIDQSSDMREVVGRLGSLRRCLSMIFAVFLGLVTSSSVANAQWLAAPVPTNCSDSIFPPNFPLTTTPNPLQSGSPYKIAYRINQKVEQYYFENITSGIRLHVRLVDTGIPSYITCNLLDPLQTAPLQPTLRIELAVYTSNGFGGFETQPRGIEQISRDIVSLAQPAPSLGSWALASLVVILIIAVRPRLRALIALALFQLIAPPPFQFHI